MLTDRLTANLSVSLFLWDKITQTIVKRKEITYLCYFSKYFAEKILIFVEIFYNSKNISYLCACIKTTFCRKPWQRNMK